MKKKLNEPSRKLGAKYLDDIQLEGCFPDWKALLTRIEEQRQIAELTGNDCYRAEDGHFPQTYDNLFAVLGGRGSGKSSVILTLREKMKYPENRDILLPIITPEIISGKECSILGWIMSAADSVVSNLEKRINKLHQKTSNCTTVWDQELDDFFKDCRFRKDNSLRRQYKELFEKTIASSGSIDLSLYSVEDAADYRTAQSRKQYKLIQDLNSFWNHLSEIWHKTYLQEILLNQGNIDEKEINKRPLIILIFDDIDLVPERSMELLNTTFQYFTNPNIVIILTAAEKVLKEVIHLKMFERMVGSEAKSLLIEAASWTNKGIEAKNQGLNSFELNPIDKMAREFYDKVIPPSSRYHLRRYESINEKEAYAYSSNGQSFEVTQAGKRVSIPIDKFLTNQVDRLIHAYSRGTKYNFLLAGKKQQIFQKAYLLIFGEKSRNIANGCLEIINTFDRLERCKQYKIGKQQEEILLTLRHLAKALLLANPALEKYADKVNSFLYPAPDRIGTYVDYNFALQCFENAKQEIRDWIESEQQQDNSISAACLFQKEIDYLRKVKDKIAALMMLLFFIEGILVIIDSKRHHIHGYRQLSYLLNTDIIDIHARKSGKKKLVLFPEHQETSDFLHNYPLVLEHSGRYLGTNQYDIQYARNYLEDIFHVRINHEEENPMDIIQAAIDKDRDWVTTVLTMLLIRFSGITLVDADCIKIPVEIQRRLDLFSFTTQFTSQRRKAIKEFLAQDNLLAAYQNKMKDFNHLIQKEYDWKGIAEQQGKFLMNAEGQTLQFSNDQFNAFVEKDTDYIKAYFVQRWKIYFGQSDETGDSLTNLCYRLLRFAKDSLKSCVALFSSQTKMHLCESAIVAIREQFDNIHAYSMNTYTKKEACIIELNNASSSLNENAHEGEADSNQANKLVTIPAAPFIDFLVTYQKEIFEEADQGLPPYAYYEISNSRNYFKLLPQLVISFDTSMDIGGVDMSGSSMVISELKMLEFLFPYEIAAHIGIAEDSRYPSELPTSEYEPSDNGVDKQLMESFQSLIKLERTEHLGKLMDEARTKLAEDYCNYLENADE